MEEELNMWEGRKVAILQPVYRTLNPDTHFTLFANYAKYGPEKIAMPRPLKGTCIWEARNRMIDHAFKTLPGVERYIMPDDDMVLPFGYPDHFNAYYGAKLPNESAGLNAISRITSHPPDKGIVGSLYVGRHEKGRCQCEWGFQKSGDKDKELKQGKYKGLQPMMWVGTGFIMIHRWVIEKMNKAIEDGMWPECKASDSTKWHGYFNPIKVGVGEDISFCKRAAEIGIQTYLDASLVCLHQGECSFGPHNVTNN